MASSLSGLILTLAWSNFPQRQGREPSPGQSATAAETRSAFSIGGISVQPVAGSSPVEFALADSLAVRVTFVRGQSHVMSWVFNRSSQFQADMLNHEQGHYNITALISRDFFVDTMLLKPQTFAEHSGRHYRGAADPAAVR